MRAMPPKHSSSATNFDPARTTIAQVQEYLKTKARQGTTCPCCRQWVQLMDRTITPGMAFVLVLLYRHGQTHRGEPGHMLTLIREAQKVGAEFKPAGWEVLTVWGLIGPRTHPKHPGKKGFFVVTDSGKAFVERKAKVRSSVLLYAGKRLGIDTESPLVGIDEVLGDYTYDDLIAGRIAALP